MADKKIEISIEDKGGNQGQQGGGSSQSDASSSQEQKQLDKLTAFWKKQEEQDKRDLENLFVESSKRLWERQEREEKQAGDTAAGERYLEQEAEAQKGLRDLIASFNDIDIPSQLDLLAGDSGALGTLDADIEAATQELLALVDGTQEATGWLSRFAAMLSSSASSAAAALGGGGGGFGGGHGAKAGVFGAFGGGSAGISVGHSLTAAALNAGGALAVLTASTWAYEKVVEKLTEATGGFSPDVAVAKARTSIMAMEDQLRMTMESGPQIAELENLRSDINSELRAIVRILVQDLGPTLQAAGAALAGILNFVRDILQFITGAKEGNDEFSKEGLLIWDALSKDTQKMLKELRKINQGEITDFFTNELIEGIFGGNQREMDRLNRQRGNRPDGTASPNAPNFV